MEALSSEHRSTKCVLLLFILWPKPTDAELCFEVCLIFPLHDRSVALDADATGNPNPQHGAGEPGVFEADDDSKFTSSRFFRGCMDSLCIRNPCY